MSALGEIPDDMELVFNPVRRPSNMEKADLGQKQTQPILDAFQAGVVGKGTVLRELKQQTPVTNMWSNITDEMIQQADEEDEQRAKEEKENKEELESGLDDILKNKKDGENSETEKEDTE